MGQTSDDFPFPTSATTEQEVYGDSGTQKLKTNVLFSGKQGNVFKTEYEL